MLTCELLVCCFAIHQTKIGMVTRSCQDAVFGECPLLLPDDNVGDCKVAGADIHPVPTSSIPHQDPSSCLVPLLKKK